MPRNLPNKSRHLWAESGLEADQKVLSTHGVYAMTATTALTAQNTLGVEEVYIIPPTFVGRQLDVVLEDVGLGDGGCVKIGMRFCPTEGCQLIPLGRVRHACERGNDRGGSR